MLTPHQWPRPQLKFRNYVLEINSFFWFHLKTDNTFTNRSKEDRRGISRLNKELGSKFWTARSGLMMHCHIEKWDASLIYPYVGHRPSGANSPEKWSRLCLHVCAGFNNVDWISVVAKGVSLLWCF